MFIGQMAEIPYLAFLASGFVAFSATNTATFEGMWSVYTRMVPQQTYEAILATPTRVDDIVLGELLWCSTKGLFSGTAILIVAALLGAVESWTAVFALPILFLTGFCFAAPALIMTAGTNSLPTTTRWQSHRCLFSPVSSTRPLHYPR